MSVMMSLVRTRILVHPCMRSFAHNKFQVAKEARMLDKMIKKTISKKTADIRDTSKLKQEFLLSAYNNEGSNRKTAALNKFYMEQLIELINTGPFSSQFNELGIEISKVRIASCRSNVNIYWVSHKEEVSETEIAKVLQNTKKELQAQMGFLRSMRKIPFVTFVKDVRLERALQVEKLFEIADFGNDNEISNPKKVVKENVDFEKKQMNNVENLKMKENVLGVDHGKIKEKILSRVKKFQAINIKQNQLEEMHQEFQEPGKLVVFNKQLFSRFYRRKQYLDRKLRERVYNETFFDLREVYDPEKEADRHWEFFGCRENIHEEELEAQNLYPDLDEDLESGYNDFNDVNDNHDYVEDKSEKEFYKTEEKVNDGNKL